MSEPARPHIVVLSTLFPHPGQPNAGVFIRERMFRVAAQLPLLVVAPQPWFPLQRLIRRWRPHFRPSAPRQEVQHGIEVYHPCFFSVPGVLKSLDGLFMALACYRLMRQLRRAGRLDVIDAHFAYPDGDAATRLGRWLGVPVTITLRGTEPRHAADKLLRPRVTSALQGAAKVFSVADSLRRLAVGLGVPSERTLVVGNGVDADKFSPMDQAQARQQLGLPVDAQVLISVGGLCERKGFHRVIDCLPALREKLPRLHYLIVGGPSAEGDNSAALHQQVERLGLQECVHFLGAMPSAQLRLPLSAADVFVLATRNEGWANVFLEAMACGLPVVTTDVGGNAEVVCEPALGSIVPFGDQPALAGALAHAFVCVWDRTYIIHYARANSWESRVGILVHEFRQLVKNSITN